MTKPITDKAEVAVEYPDKLYIGTFAHSARFDAHIDKTGISLTLEVPGPVERRKSVRMHFHHALFADILRDLAKTVAALPPEDLAHRDSLRGQGALYRARNQPGRIQQISCRRSVTPGCGRNRADRSSGALENGPFPLQRFRFCDQIESRLLKGDTNSGFGKSEREPKTKIRLAAQAFRFTLCQAAGRARICVTKIHKVTLWENGVRLVLMRAGLLNAKSNRLVSRSM
jgi:hypothetical protein